MHLSLFLISYDDFDFCCWSAYFDDMGLIVLLKSNNFQQ